VPSIILWVCGWTVFGRSRFTDITREEFLLVKRVEQVEIGDKSLSHLQDHFGPKLIKQLNETFDRLQTQLNGRTFWHVNSTAKGGGVAEMLPHMLGYMQDFGIDSRWLVISGAPEFFNITKRLHHALHGSAGDGSPLGQEQRDSYEAVIAENAAEVLYHIQSEDVVLLHDPQTAGLIPHLAGKVGSISWRCHIGHDDHNFMVDLGWSFLEPYLKQADAYVFSRSSYIPNQLDRARCSVIAPSIDPLAPKNEPMDENTIHEILGHIGYLSGVQEDGGLQFERNDGSMGRVERFADIVRHGPAPNVHTPFVVQISRWDPLKDPVGVLEGFVKLLRDGSKTDAHLALVGPDVKSVTDDPEGIKVFEQVEKVWRDLPEELRHRVQLVSLPMTDVEENAAMVNAIQRHAEIIVQKSLHEGFGLTVTEAMWKGRPVVGSAVGGIQDQIEHDVSGILLKDPKDIDEYAGVLARLLQDSELRKTLGNNAKARVEEHFLVTRHFKQYLELIEYVDSGEEYNQLAG